MSTEVTIPEVEQPIAEVPSGCITLPDGTIKCPDTNANSTCNPFDLQEQADACIINDWVNEAVNIAGATANVFKLLGVYEQGKLVDLIGNGSAISGGNAPGFPPGNAFISECSAWRSGQRGPNVVASSWLGYDFGYLKLDNGRVQHGVPKPETMDVSRMSIKQGAESRNRITRARIERSQDGVKWYGVEIVDIEDTDALVTFDFRRSVPSRFWRIRPVAFNGDVSDFWAVLAVQFFDYEATRIDNVQDRLLLENRNRDYLDTSLKLKVYYDLIDTQTELSRFGIELSSQSFYMSVPFNTCVAVIGRPLVIGDIIELPSEVQFSASLDPIKKYLEVIDVGWSTEGYTPGWRPTLLRVIAQPMMASQETQDIVGDFVGITDTSGLFNKDDGNDPIIQDYSETAQYIDAASRQEDAVPQRGSEAGNDIQAFTDQEVQAGIDAGVDIQKLSYNPRGLYIEDALPPNGLPFTMGDTFPENPSSGDYHRLTYSGLADDLPARLHRYSGDKGQWIFLEKDRRDEYDANRKKIQEFIDDPTATPNGKISDK